MSRTRSRRAAGHGFNIDISRTLENAGVIGLWEYRLDEGLVYCDAPMAVFYGVDPQLAYYGVSPEHFRRSICTTDIDMAILTLGQAIKSGNDYLVRYRVRRRDGALRLVEVRGRPKLRRGKTISVAGVNTDVTSQTGTQANPLHQLTGVSLEAMSLARMLNDSDLQLFARMLAIQVGTSLGQDLMNYPEGSA